MFLNGLLANSQGNKADGNECGSEQCSGAEKDGAVSVSDSSGFRLHCMTVVGQVEGHYYLPETQKVTKYEHMIPALAEVEEHPQIDGLLMILHTMGGDVEAGLAIAEMIAGMEKPTVSLVLGGGHSIGVPLAVAAKRSFIVPTATMTLHPVRINGLVVGAPQSFDYLQKIQDRIIGFICRNSHADEAVLRHLIMKSDELVTDMGTVIDGKEAVHLGLVDEVGGLSSAIRSLKEMCKRGHPT